ncbi:MAG TPA: VOC family protein [Acidimicrobiales bacterium]|nr:VOC family protein [Acidimicrobiales bacterium]
MPKITPFLWFDDQAGEAVDFYLSVFPNSRVTSVARHGEAGPGPAGSVMTIGFELDGQPFTALNGGPAHYGFDESVSFVVHCPTEEEVDHYWSRLTDGGEEIACGWLKDRYGLRWQIVPDGFVELMQDADPERAARVMQAMMTMTKLDLRALRAAADGSLVQPAG